MQRTNDLSWWQRSRMPGILRYHGKTAGRELLFVLAIFTCVELLAVLFPLVTSSGRVYFYGLQGGAAWASIAVFVVVVSMVFRRTRFLLRFGTPRVSVWLGNVIALTAFAVALYLALSVVYLAAAYAVCALGVSRPDTFEFGAAQLSGAVTPAGFGLAVSAYLRALPQTLLDILCEVSWCYFFGCCLRRRKGLTLAIVIGLPMLLLILSVIPAVQQGVNALQGGDAATAMNIALQFYRALADIGRWLIAHFVLVECVLTAVFLPLSYLIMRRTPQP